MCSAGNTQKAGATPKCSLVYCSFVSALFWCLLISQWFTAPAHSQDTNQNLKKFLQRNNLQRLSLIQTENEYSRQTDAAKRLGIATELVKRYRKQLLNPSDRDDIPRLIKKSKSLLTDFPQLNSPQLQIATSHSDFLWSESRFLQWWQDGAATQDADPLSDSFKKLEKDLETQRRQQTNIREELLSTLPLASNSTDQANRINEVESRIAHLDFLSGWANYFLAIITPPADANILQRAHQNFYQSLHIEHVATIEKVGSKWLEIEGVFSRRAVLGLGLIYTARQEHEPANFCFNELQKQDASFEANLWRLNALAFARNWPLLLELNSQIDLQSLDRPEKRKYFKSITNAGIVAESFASNQTKLKTAKLLQRVGFMGMLKELDFESLISITKNHKFEFEDANASDLWLQAAMGLQQADDEPQMNQLARDQLEKALQLAEADAEFTDQAQIKYLLALAEYKIQNFKSALNLLDDDVCENAHILLAESATWLRSRILVGLSRRQKAQIPAALAILNKLDSRFPNSRFSNRVQFEKLLLESKLMRADQANALLDSIEPQNRFYLEAVFEKATNNFNQWRTLSQQNSPMEAKRFDKLKSTATLLIEDPRTSIERRTKAMSYLIDASISRGENEQTIQDLFAQYKTIVAQQESANPKIEAEYKYHQFRFANRQRHFESADRLADWIIDNSPTKPHRIAALGFLARRSEDIGAAIDRDIQIYQKLTDELGTDTSMIQSSTNARVAAHRFVELLIRVGNYEKASRINDQLVAVFPNRQPYLLSAARIATASKDPSDALTIWRKLAAGTKTGDSIWLEAKYSIAKILAQSDVELSRQIIEQTLALTDEVPDQWQTNFAKLAKELSQDNLKKE